MPPKGHKKKNKKKEKEMEPIETKITDQEEGFLNSDDVAEADKPTKRKSPDPGPVQVLINNVESYLDEWVRERKKVLPLSRTEKKKFINVCVDNGLDPVRGEVFLVETGSPFQKGVVDRQPSISFETFLKRFNEIPGLDRVIRYKFDVSCEVNPLTNEPDALGMSQFLFQDNIDESNVLKVKAINSCHGFWYSNFRRDSSYHRKMPNLAFLRVCFVTHARMVFPRELAGLPLIKDEIQEGKFEYSTVVTPPERDFENPPPKKLPKKEETPAAPKNELSQKELPFREEGKNEEAQEKSTGNKNEFDFNVPYPETGHKNQSSKESHDEMLILLEDNQNVIAGAHINRALDLLQKGMTQSNSDILRDTIRKATFEMQRIYAQVETWLENNLVNAARVSEVATGICRALWLSLRKNEEIRAEYAESRIPVEVIKNTMVEAGYSLMLLLKK